VDAIHAILTEEGVAVSRSTLHTDLRELLGEPIAQMVRRPMRLDGVVWWVRRGANIYDLAQAPANRGGRLFRLVLRRIHELLHQRSSGTGGRDSLSGTGRLSPSLVDRRVQGALEKAILVAPGQRNTVGNWLAWRCRSLELGQYEVEGVMRRFVDAVGWWAGGDGRPYTLRDALATVRCLFRKAPPPAIDRTPCGPLRGPFRFDFTGMTR
jgi:hypothetical protein